MVLKEQLGVDRKELKSDADLRKLGMDELDKVEIVMSLEEMFGVDITDEGVDKWKTVGDVVECIVKKGEENKWGGEKNDNM